MRAMTSSIFKTGALIALIALQAACSTTQTDLLRASYLGSDETQQLQSDCMADQPAFNSRNTMLAPASIEGAWIYCKRAAELWPYAEEPAVSSGWSNPR